MLGSCSRGLHEEDVTLRHILLRMRMGTEFRVYKQVVDAELTTIAAILQQAFVLFSFPDTWPHMVAQMTTRLSVAVSAPAALTNWKM